MPYRHCQLCTERFYVRPNHIKRGWGKYCSRNCSLQDRPKAGKIIPCYICKKEVYKAPKALHHSKSGKHFCGKSCQTIWRNTMVYIGSDHPNWKDGGSRHYRDIIRKSKQKEICQLCKTIDKRILAVHHLDRNHRNNDLKNLIWLCHNCHFLIHHYNEERQKLSPLA